MFDVYEGKGIEPGKKSIAIAVTMQPRDKTMTDAEIDALGQKIVAEVGKRTGGVLRRPKPAANPRKRKAVALRPSRPTLAPQSCRLSIGPADTKEWNSPFSPHGSMPAGSAASSAASKRRPANEAGNFFRSTDGKMRLDAGRDHVARQLRGRLQPERKHRRDAGAGELASRDRRARPPETDRRKSYA